MKLKGKNVVIYGAGISGMSAYELVKEKGARAAVIYDDDPAKPHATSSVGVFDAADVIVLSPGVASEKDFLLDAKLENKVIISEMELASRFCMAEQIAVTGTNGKTTTTLLIDHIFKCAHLISHAVGNIGVAFSAIADKLDATEIAVVEVSSFQLESAIDFAPDYAVILNVTPDHLERHGTMERYATAKANIFLKQSECDVIVYNDDDEYIQKMVPLMVAKRVPFSVSRPVDGAYISSGLICFKGKPVVELEDIDFSGRELENVLAATAVCMSHGVNAYTVASALISFKRPDFRRKVSAVIDGVSFFNDSKATNVYSTLSGAESMDGDTVLILGGAKRCENFNELFEKLGSNIKYIVVTGENAEDIYSCAKAAEFQNICIADDLKQATDVAFAQAKADGIKNILFSPSSKSFDRYSSYAERGRAFDATVAQLKRR
jgi:UDP-N-acetylmuramoylalanine--D-glutamate ligase